jgi:hypothetical protein
VQFDLLSGLQGLREDQSDQIISAPRQLRTLSACPDDSTGGHPLRRLI